MNDKPLKITRFGDPVLRSVAKPVHVSEIKSVEMQNLISRMKSFVKAEKYGVGLAAPQVGMSLAMAIIGIKPTPSQPDRKRFDQVIINPSYKGIGKVSSKWEACVSSGRNEDLLYGKAQRYNKIEAEWYDQEAKLHKELLDGFVAHVFQHETDHLNGILFVDRVKDTKTFMMADEYRKRIVNK